MNESRAGVDPSLQPALDALTDDAAVDWNDLESRAPDPAVRETVRRLRIIARVAHAHEFASTLRDGQPFVPNLATPCDWGPLRVIESLARGAYGEVYRAWDPRLEREVALKLIDHDAGTDPGNGTVIEEGRVLARVRHPNVVTVYGADRRDGRIGIWTEFVNGRTLGQCLQQDGLFAPHDAASIIVDVCRGLAAVHCAGLVHGDIKSTNVMRGDEGRIVLMDFGASRYRDELQPVRIAGTPAYMAPEVIEGGRPNVRSDLYSVGVLLYHLVTGRYPVERSTFVELRDAYRQRSDLPLVDLRRDFPSPLAAVVQRALSRDPAHRYSSADAMADAIAAALDPAAPKPAVDVTSGRARWGIAAAVVLAVGVAAALGVYGVRTPTAQASLTFAPRDYVLITKFENRTGESIFDGAVEYALQRALSESTVVSLVPDERIEDALALMKRPRQTVIDKTIGREVAVRDGHIKALLAGRVERFGTSYVITAQLIDPSDNAVVATLGESARGQNGVLDALQRQAMRVRGALGEKLPAIHGADPNVEQASTSSLEAFQLYNESYRLGRENKWPAALATARQVVTVDPDFASGWIWLAWAVRNTEGIDAGTPEDPQISRYREYVDRAMQLVNRVPAWERHWVTGSYYTLTAQFASSIPEYQALLKFRPDHYFASNNLLRALLRLHRSQDYPLYLSTRQQTALQRPNDPGALVDAAQAAVQQTGRAQSSQRFIDRLTVLAESDAPVAQVARAQRDFARAYVLWASGEVSATLEQVNAIAAAVDSYPASWHLQTVMGVVDFYQSLGRVRDRNRFADSLKSDDDRQLVRLEQVQITYGIDAASLPTIRRLLGTAAHPPNRGITGLDYVRAGLLDQARLYAAGKSPNYNSGQAAITKGMLALLAHRLTEAKQELTRGLELMVYYNNPTYWAACESLADVLWQLNQRQDAIASLEQCSSNGFKTIGVWAPLGEVRARLDLHLARLYKSTGDVRAAEAVEARVRARLRLADHDYPLLQELH